MIEVDQINGPNIYLHTDKPFLKKNKILADKVQLFSSFVNFQFNIVYCYINYLYNIEYC